MRYFVKFDSLLCVCLLLILVYHCSYC